MNLETLYKKMYPRIVAYFYIKTNNQQMAEDLAQEVFYEAIKKINTFSNKSTIETWIFAIAKNRLRNFYRGKKYQEKLFEKILKEEENVKTPEAVLLEKEKKVSINEAIHRLEELEKDVVTLRIYGELSFKEIAQLVGKSENHVRILFHRAKLKIKKELDVGLNG